MPTLNWIGKEAVVNHHNDVPFHLLKDVPELACGDPGSGNLIVQGDNLVALKALLTENLADIQGNNRYDMSWQFLSRKNGTPSTMAA